MYISLNTLLLQLLILTAFDILSPSTEATQVTGSPL